MTRPNILFICSDQHRYDCVRANGHPFVQTPNMDRLAAEGARFTHAFTPSPICVPSRCSLLSGQWPGRHGVVFNFDGETFKPLDPSRPTCARAVRDAGYHAIHVDHWHVDHHHSPHDYGFHDYVPEWRYHQWREARGLPARPRDIMGGTDPVRYEDSHLAWSAGETIRWLEHLRGQPSPFLMHWQVVEPHLPCTPTEPYASMYRPEDIPPWPSFDETFEGKPYIVRQMVHTWGLQNMAWRDWAPAVARYLGLITQLDRALGDVLGALDRLGLARNTLVIYTCDHGDMCGAHRMIDKHNILYDDVTRVPLLMRWPGVIPAGRVVDDFSCNAIDAAATFCAAAQAPIPPSFQGVDLLPAAMGTGTTGREDIFATFSGNQFGGFSQRMVRDRRWKYVWNATDTDELYDLERDPAELHNRIRDPACADEVRRLRARLLDWMEKSGDPLFNGWLRRQIGENRKL